MRGIINFQLKQEFSQSKYSIALSNRCARSAPTVPLLTVRRTDVDSTRGCSWQPGDCGFAPQWRDGGISVGTETIFNWRGQQGSVVCRPVCAMAAPHLPKMKAPISPVYLRFPFEGVTEKVGRCGLNVKSIGKNGPMRKISCCQI